MIITDTKTIFLFHMWLERCDFKKPLSKNCTLASFFFSSHNSVFVFSSAAFLADGQKKKRENKAQRQETMENLTLKRPAVSQSRKAKAQANIKRSDWRPACTKGTFLPRSVLCAGGDAPQCLCEAWIQLKQCVLRGGCASGKLPFSLF